MYLAGGPDSAVLLHPSLPRAYGVPYGAMQFAFPHPTTQSSTSADFPEACEACGACEAWSLRLRTRFITVRAILSEAWTGEVALRKAIQAAGHSSASRLRKAMAFVINTFVVQAAGGAAVKMGSECNASNADLIRKRTKGERYCINIQFDSLVNPIQPVGSVLDTLVSVSNSSTCHVEGA
jgi:hypothetical protein